MGRNRAFIDWVGSVVQVGLSGLTPTSNTATSFRWMLSTIETFSPAWADPVETAKWVNRYAKIARLLIKEHVFLQLMPVLRYDLARVYPQLYASLVLQSTVTVDEVRCVLDSELRRDPDRFREVVGTRLAKVVVQRTKYKSRKASTQSSATISAEKKAKHEVQTRYKEEMMPVSNVPAETDVFAVCCEIIDHQRSRSVEASVRSTHTEFYEYIVRMHLEKNLRPAKIAAKDVEMPLENHVYRLVNTETRRAIVSYARATITRDTRVDLMCLAQFGVSEQNCRRLSAMRELFCGKQSCKTSVRCVFDFPPVEQFAVYYFCAVATQVMSYRIIRVGVETWAASQVLRAANIIGTTPSEVPASMHSLVFSERTCKLLSSVSVCALGPKGTEHSIITGDYYDGSSDVMKKRKQYPALGLVRLNLIDSIVEFTRPMKTSSKFRRKPQKNSGDGGLGSARHLALRVQKQADEEKFRVICDAKTYALQPLETIIDTRIQQSRVMNLMIGREVVSRHMPSVRKSFPVRQAPFVVPPTPARHPACFIYGKRARAVWYADCCGMATRVSPQQLNVWDQHPFIWCGYCASPENTRRYIPICVACQHYTERKFRGKRTAFFDDAHTQTWTQAVICDSCHYLLCERTPGRTMTIKEARNMLHARSSATHSPHVTMAL